MKFTQFVVPLFGSDYDGLHGRRNTYIVWLRNECNNGFVNFLEIDN
jgi:hypothetical protein